MLKGQEVREMALTQTTQALCQRHALRKTPIVLVPNHQAPTYFVEVQAV
jgi:hypothetical protein